MNRRSDRTKQQGKQRLERGGDADRGSGLQRHWRVFEYRRPIPVRARFTT
jgi:hypothetical protein